MNHDRQVQRHRVVALSPPSSSCKAAETNRCSGPAPPLAVTESTSYVVSLIPDPYLAQGGNGSRLRSNRQNDTLSESVAVTRCVSNHERRHRVVGVSSAMQQRQPRMDSGRVG